MDSLLPFLQGLAPLQHAGFIPALEESAVILPESRIGPDVRFESSCPTSG